MHYTYVAPTSLQYSTSIFLFKDLTRYEIVSQQEFIIKCKNLDGLIQNLEKQSLYNNIWRWRIEEVSYFLVWKSLLKNCPGPFPYLGGTPFLPKPRNNWLLQQINYCSLKYPPQDGLCPRKLFLIDLLKYSQLRFVSKDVLSFIMFSSAGKFQAVACFHPHLTYVRQALLRQVQRVLQGQQSGHWAQVRRLLLVFYAPLPVHM
jgi:hypothetical protein